MDLVGVVATSSETFYHYTQHHDVNRGDDNDSYTIILNLIMVIPQYTSRHEFYNF